MNKRAILILGIAAMILLGLSLGAAQSTVAKEVKRIPAGEIKQVTPPLAAGAKDYCYLTYAAWQPAYWVNWLKRGDKIAVYYDPDDCGFSQNYPFQLTDVHLMLYDHAEVGSVTVRFSVEVMCPDICDGPGIEIWKSRPYSIVNFYPDPVEIWFEDTVCLDKPFFFNVEYLSDYPEGFMPSFMIEDSYDTGWPDTCYQWVWYGQPSWIEWYNDLGGMGAGWIILGISGYVADQANCGWWYWKPDTLPQAPSGMPDFDQNQRDWVAYCGPTAVANCLWWFDAVPTAGMDPADFIELLAGYFGTTSGGTYVDSIQLGLEEYFADYGFALKETTYWMPDFHEMEDSLKKCQDIILLLGFWWYVEGTEQEFIRGDITADGVVDLQDIVTCQGGPPFPCMDAADVNDDGVFDMLDCDYLNAWYFGAGPPPPPPFPDCGTDPTADGLDCQSFPPCPGGSPGEWFREGGHFVTMAGVNSEKKEIAISDPDRDQVVRYPWWPGRVRLADHPPWGAYPPDFHNDPNYVSHDIYISLLFPEFPSPGSDIWDLADYCYGQTFPAMNVPHRFEAYSRVSPKHYEYFHTEVEAAIMICPKPSPDTLRNHFKTWRIEPEPFSQIVFVEDQFMFDTLFLETIEFFSNPARKDTFEIVDEFEHLTWYRAQGRNTLLEVEYRNQFGTYTNTIDSVKYLLLPTAKETYPFPESLDHYKAYRIKDPVSFDRELVLEDQFDVMYGSPEFIETLKPTYFLTPALKNMPPPMFDSITHYVAYEIFPQHYYGLIQVQADDQFGEHFLQVDTSKFLLVPTVKLRAEPPPNDPPEIGQPDFLEGYVDDIVSYDITGSDPNGDVILDEASIDIQPGCGSWDIVRTSGHGTSTGTWEITWITEGCTPCDTHMVIHDLTDEHGATAYCTTWVHLSSGRECDDNDPKECDTLWVECGNMLVPPGGGLVTIDMTIANDESLMAIQVPLSYQGSPVCCDSMPEDENLPAKVFAGSGVENWVIKIITIDHVAKTVGVAAYGIPGVDPPVTPGKGHFATLTLLGDSCCTIQLDTTVLSGNAHVGFVDANDPDSTLFYPVVRIDTCHIDRNYPPVIGQPDYLEGYVDDVVQYDITGTDPDGDAIEDDASIDIQPGCGNYSITRTSGHGTSSGTWQVTWNTDGCTPCDTHMVIHDLTDALGFTGYCTTLVHLSEEFDTTWYWKPPYDDYAPNGMPDIDQKQDGWRKLETEQWSFCGPCAVANCFKWFDSKYNDVAPGFPGDGIDQFPLVRDYLDDLGPLVGYDDHDPWNVDHVGTPWGPAIGPPPATLQPFVPGPQIPGGGLPPWGELVERLAWFFDTDGIQTGYCQHTGTNVMDMQAGIQEWLESERFEDAVPQFVRGDVNGDGNVDLADAAACVAGGPYACDDAADINDDGVLDMADCTYLTDYLTAGGPAPPRPFPDCGIDPTIDGLGCNDYPLCPWSNTLADSLCEVTTPMPSFTYVESLVHKCEDVILLLGFWYEDPPGSGEWWRIGGHYVTVAGVNSEYFKIAFSDPFIDNAEFGAPGRVGDGTIIPHDFPHDPTVHNDEGNVSHDIYDVEIPSISPGGEWWLPGYAINGDPGYWVWNFHDQNVPEEFEPMTAQWNGTSPIHTEVEYCVHISPWDYRGDANADGIVNVGDVVYIVSFLYRLGPAPVPMSQGDANCDGIVNVGDVVYLVNYLFRNGPVPRCCDP